MGSSRDSRVLRTATSGGAYFIRAFTLIELLVVGLIIGILVAIAVSQYEKAVWKSRFLQAKKLAENIAVAKEIYYMSNGQYTKNFDELAIFIPIPIKDITCKLEAVRLILHGETVL